jgi:hypothetical protein
VSERDEIIISALTRELGPAAATVGQVLAQNGVLPKNDKFAFWSLASRRFSVADFDVAACDADREALVAVLAGINNETCAFISKQESRRKEIHEAAAHYDAVRSRLKVAQGRADGAA